MTDAYEELKRLRADRDWPTTDRDWQTTAAEQDHVRREREPFGDRIAQAVRDLVGVLTAEGIQPKPVYRQTSWKTPDGWSRSYHRVRYQDLGQDAWIIAHLTDCAPGCQLLTTGGEIWCGSYTEEPKKKYVNISGVKVAGLNRGPGYDAKPYIEFGAEQLDRPGALFGRSWLSLTAKQVGAVYLAVIDLNLGAAS